LISWSHIFSLCLSSALDAENVLRSWFIIDDKIKLETPENNAHLYTMDKKHICLVCKVSFKSIRELHLHSKTKRTHINSELDELANHSKKNRSNIEKNMKKLKNTQKIKRNSSPARSTILKCNEMLDEVPKCAETVFLQHNCSICSKWFLHEERLKLHLLDHSYVDILECPTCNEKFSTNKECRSHVELHLTFKLCVLCNERFSKKSWFTDHMHTEHCVQSSGAVNILDPKTGRHVCQCCGETFSEIKSLLAHMTHFEETNAVCNVCGKTYASRSRLKSHLIHSSCNGRKYDCPDCEKQFSSKITLLYHSRVHTGVLPPKTFVCARCGETYEKEYCLKRHMISRHNGERPFLCTVCSKTFTFIDLLRYHMLSHSDDRPHACQVCPAESARFKTKSQLTKHMRIHAERRLFFCEVCRKGFNFPKNLKVHMTKHSDEHVFKCTDCDESFRHRETWKKHLKRHL